jgi:hypothetical protein
MSNAFDFKSKLSQIQPKSSEPSERSEPIEVIDQIAERREFKSREPATRVRRVRQSEPIEVLSVKGPLSVMNRFKEYANAEGHTSYWTAIDALLKRAGR